MPSIAWALTNTSAYSAWKRRERIALLLLSPSQKKEDVPELANGSNSGQIRLSYGAIDQL